MPPPSPKTPEPRSKQIDLSTQRTIIETINKGAQTPTPTQTTQDTDMTDEQQAFHLLTQHQSQQTSQTACHASRSCHITYPG